MKFPGLLKLVTPDYRRLTTIVCLLLLGSGVSLSQPWIAGQATGLVLGDTPVWIPSLSTLIAAWLLLLFFKGITGFLTQYLIGLTGEQMASRLRSRVYDHLQSLPLQYYQARKAGELQTLLSNDASIISYFITNTLVKLLPLLVTFFGALLIMIRLDPIVAAVIAFLLPVYFLAMKLIGRRIRPVATQWIESWTDMISLVQENLSMIAAIKSFVREPIERSRFTARNEEFFAIAKKYILIQSILAPAIGFLAGAGLLLLFWMGYLHTQSGQLSPSDLVSLMLYAALLTGPLSGLANVYGELMRTRGAAERLLDFFAQPSETGKLSPSEKANLGGEIEFQNVDFSYADRKPVLSNFNLTVAAGEIIALTGPNGSGKSTLAHLLLRLIEPQGGTIRIGGIDIQKMDLASLRRQVGLVSQNTLLMNGTIAENIRYGDMEATQDQIRRAAEAAHAHEFICEFPDQYDTVIGDQGVKLSGGQRQRLSLARTLLLEPAILILDEATAMFDPQGEQLFIKDCQQLFQHQTVILISHRPSSLEMADRVILMDVSNPTDVPLNSL